MEVRPGYKHTEVGVIPKDWDAALLGECLASRPSYGINAAAVAYSDKLPVYIRITDITEDGRFAPDKPVSVRSEFSGNYYLSEGDIVFARTGASVGKSYRYNPSDGPLVFAGFLVRIRPDASKLSPAFAAAYLTTGGYWRWVRLMSMRSGQPGINGNEYAQLPIPVPQLPEQRAIAEVLGDVDALQAGLDRIIAKKRDLKQAAMQQLLTGQTRLPGFQGEWETQPVASVVADLEAGVSVNSVAGASYLGSGEPGILKTSCIADGIFDPSEYKLIDARELGRAKLNPRRDTLIISRMNTPNLVGEVGFVEHDYPNLFLPDRLWMTRFRPESALCPKWLAYLLSSPAVKQAIKDLASGTSGSMKNIAKGKLLALPLVFPPAREQEAIATILSDMDAELTALEARRDKTRALKQGMMQELLTGRTRLV